MAVLETIAALVADKAVATVAATTIASAAVVGAGVTDNLGPAQNAFDRVEQAVTSQSSQPDDLPDAAVDGQQRAEEAQGQHDEGTQSQGRDGQEVSGAVHDAIDSTEPGPERGAAVSEAASQGRSQAGEHATGGDEVTADAATEGSDTGDEAAEEGAENGEEPPTTGEDAADARDGNADGTEGEGAAEDGQGHRPDEGPEAIR